MELDNTIYASTATPVYSSSSVHMDEASPTTHYILYSSHPDDDLRLYVPVRKDLANVYPFFKSLDCNILIDGLFEISLFKTSDLLCVKNYVENGNAMGYQRTVYDFFGLIPPWLNVRKSASYMPYQMMVIKMEEAWYLMHPDMPVPRLMSSEKEYNTRGAPTKHLYGVILKHPHNHIRVSDPDYTLETHLKSTDDSWYPWAERDIVKLHPWIVNVPGLSYTTSDTLINFYFIVSKIPISSETVIKTFHDHLSLLKDVGNITVKSDAHEVSIEYDMLDEGSLMWRNKISISLTIIHPTVNHLLYTIPVDSACWARTHQGVVFTQRCLYALTNNLNTLPYLFYSIDELVQPFIVLMEHTVEGYGLYIPEVKHNKTKITIFPKRDETYSRVLKDTIAGFFGTYFSQSFMQEPTTPSSNPYLNHLTTPPFIPIEYIKDDRE